MLHVRLGAVSLFDLDARGVATIGDIPRGLPKPSLPDLSGIDLTDRAVEFTRNRLDLYGLHSELRVGDATIKDQTFAAASPVASRPRA